MNRCRPSRTAIARGAPSLPRAPPVSYTHLVLKACEDPATAARVRAIVCLNTPFISAWQPAVGRQARPWARIGLCLLAAGLGMAFWMLGEPFVDPLQPLSLIHI